MLGCFDELGVGAAVHPGQLSRLFSRFLCLAYLSPADNIYNLPY